MLERVSIVYHSINGFTNRVATHIYDGILNSGHENCRMHNVEFLSADDWEYIRSADGLIFGTPVYFGGVSGQFKRFMDQTNTIFEKGIWRGKAACGFVTASDVRFDSFSCLNQLLLFSAQHGMMWINPLALISHDQIADRKIETLVISYGVAVYAIPGQPASVVPAQDVRMLGALGVEFAKGYSKSSP